MQTILARLVQQLTRKGMKFDQAREVAIKTLQDSGALYRGTTQLTPKGIERSAMGARGRAIDRAAKASGRDPSEYVYSSKTNRATLKE